MPDSVSEKTPPEAPASVPAPQVIVVPTVVVPVVVPVPVPIPSATAKSISMAELSESVTVPEKSVSANVEIPRSPPGALSVFWRKFGGTGFVVSALFHFGLIVFALFYVFSTLEEVPEKASFVSGSGGSRAARGETLSEKVFRRTEKVRSPKIFAKNAKATVVLPEMPKMQLAQNFGFSKKIAGAGGNAEGGRDEAGTGGFGGGVGLGAGIGIGDGKNHLGTFKTLLGAKIKAQKIAVYLDCSGSMKSFLPAVKAEIYEKFPDADIFAFSGAKTEIADGEIIGARTMKAKTLSALKQKKATDETETAKLSGQGRVIYGKFAGNFAAGTLGAWVDVLTRERYDALVVFSDFRDGFRQRRNGKTVYADSSYAPATDERTLRECSWEKEWVSVFSKKNAPKLYLFSVRSRPQDFWGKCVEASGGEITILNLKKSRKK